MLQWFLIIFRRLITVDKGESHFLMVTLAVEKQFRHSL